MKFSPKLVKIFSDEFSVDFSPFLVIFFWECKNRWVVKWWNFHQNWWKYFLMNFLLIFHHFRGFLWGNEQIGEWLSDEMFTKIGNFFCNNLETCQMGWYCGGGEGGGGSVIRTCNVVSTCRKKWEHICVLPATLTCASPIWIMLKYHENCCGRGLMISRIASSPIPFSIDWTNIEKLKKKKQVLATP